MTEPGRYSSSQDGPVVTVTLKRRRNATPYNAKLLCRRVDAFGTSSTTTERAGRDPSRAGRRLFPPAPTSTGSSERSGRQPEQDEYEETIRKSHVVIYQGGR